jgi:hypothetical protein
MWYWYPRAMRSALSVTLAFLAGMILTAVVLTAAVAFLPGPVGGGPTPSPTASSVPSTTAASPAPSVPGPGPSDAAGPSGATASPPGPSGSPAGSDAAGPSDAGPGASP